MKELKKLLKICCIVLTMVLLLCSCDLKNELKKDNRFIISTKNISNKSLLRNGTQEAINAKYKNVIKKYFKKIFLIW